MIVPSQSLNTQQQEVNNRTNMLLRDKHTVRPKQDSNLQISEQQVKELHLLYEHTLNKKKEKMYDYEMDVNI